MSTSLTARRIAAVFAECHSEETACDEAAFIRKIDGFVARGEAVPFLFLGFPQKSMNEASVSGYLPDFGEELAFRTLRDLIQRAQHVYAPGIEINIFSEGSFLLPVGFSRPAWQIDAYVEGLRVLKGSDRIKIHTIHDLYPDGSLEDKLSAFSREYLPSAVETHTLVRQDAAVCKRYTDRLAFVYSEFSRVLFPSLSNTQRHRASKMMARTFTAHQLGVDRLSVARFGHAVRLSIHRQDDPSSQKYYIKLIPEAEGAGTPWLHVVVQDGGRLRVMKKHEAEAMMVSQEKPPAAIQVRQ